MIINFLQHIDHKIGSRTFLAIYLGIVALWSFSLSFQGLAMDEDGYLMSAFQQVFNDPSSAEGLFPYYLHLIIGGVWNLLFGSLGLYSSRLLSIILLLAIAYTIYLFFIRLTDRWYILLGVVILLHCSGDGIHAFNYNPLSVLFTLICCYHLFLGLIGGKSWHFILAGFMLGINVLVRLPNIALGLLVFAFIPYAFYNRCGIVWRKILLSFTGFVAGLVSVFLLMLALGHVGTFAKAMEYLVLLVSDPESTHGTGRMLTTYVLGYWNVLIQCVLIFAFPVVSILLSRWRAYKEDHELLMFVMLTVMPFCVILSTGKMNHIYSLIGVIMVSLMAAMVMFRERKDIVYASLIVLLATNLQYLGSDFGFRSFTEVSWLSFPLALGLLPKEIGCLVRQKEIRITVGAFLTAFFVAYVVNGAKRQLLHFLFYEDSPRWTMLYKPDAPLATTLVSRENKEILDSSLVELRKYVKKDDYLFAYENLPMMNYLTETRPYVYNPWTWMLAPADLKRHIERAERERRYLPVIMISKGMMSKYTQYDPRWNDAHAQCEPGDFTHSNRRVALYHDFIRRHHYRKVWESGSFVIMLPPEIKNK